MKYTSWNGGKEIEMLDCPFCGGEPKVKHIGNDRTKRRAIEVSCEGCRCKRTDAAIYHGFDWIEEIAAKNWNQRPPTP